MAAQFTCMKGPSSVTFSRWSRNSGLVGWPPTERELVRSSRIAWKSTPPVTRGAAGALPRRRVTVARAPPTARSMATYVPAVGPG